MTKRTKEISESLNPVWSETLTKDINMDYSEAMQVLFQVYDSDITADQLMGFVNVPIKDVFENQGKFGFNQIV